MARRYKRVIHSKTVVFSGLAALSWCCACAGKGEPSAVAPPPASAEIQEPAPLTPPSPRVRASEEEEAGGTYQVPHDEFSPTLVFVPKGRGKLPVWFVAHGAGGTAEEQLQYWSRLLGGRSVIVSLAGKPLRKDAPTGGHFFSDHFALGREVDNVLAHLRDPGNRNAPYVKRAEEPPYAFGAYSQGATMGAWFLLERGQLFARLMLIEGGYEGWSLPRARAYRAEGGSRVAWICGTQSCSERARDAAKVAERAGLATQMEWVDGGGHAYWGIVEPRVQERLAWLIEP